MENKDHEGSLGTDRNPPAGTETEEERLARQKAEQEAQLKKRIEELRKRDPFIYRQMETPCVQVCNINKDDFCTGCKRTREEISQWLYLTPERRTHIMRLLKNRHIENTHK